MICKFFYLILNSCTYCDASYSLINSVGVFIYKQNNNTLVIANNILLISVQKMWKAQTYYSVIATYSCVPTWNVRFPRTDNNGMRTYVGNLPTYL